MRQRERFLFVFSIFLILSIIIFLLSFSGHLQIPVFFWQNNTAKLNEKNLDSITKIVYDEKLKKENAALLDQFQTAKPKSYNLIPAHIIGVPNFIPGVTTPTNFILDKGEADKIKVGLAVVYKNNLIGKVIAISSNLSKVELVIDSSSSFPAKTESEAIGVIKGDGRGMVLENVLLSENLKIDDIVTTKGDVDLKGTGYPADLVVGKIKSIDKNPSSLFQKAKVESLVNFNKLSTVFVIAKLE